MSISTSWLIDGRVLFVTSSSPQFDHKELQELIQSLSHYVELSASDSSLYFIHDLRTVQDRKQVVLYVNSLYPQLISISRQVLVLSDTYWALEKRLLRHALKNYGEPAVVYSLDESFQYLQQLDRSLPNLRAAFRARVRQLLQHPLESLPD